MAKTAGAKALDPLEAAKILKTLKGMEKDDTYNTDSRYATDTLKYPDNLITFSQRHMEHLRKFPNINPDQYIVNLKLMTRISVS